MHVQSEQQLIEFNGWVLRVHPSPARHARLLLLLHGWTGDEDSMWVFVRNFSPGYWMMAPRGLHAARPSGFTWRPDQTGEHENPTLENLRPSAEALMLLIDDYAGSQGIEAGQFDVIGFSQGAVLAHVLALLFPGRVRRAGVLSGFVPDGEEPLLADGRLRGKPFFIAHGGLDEMVPIELARQSVESLKRAGARVTYCEEQVGHKVGVNCMRALEKFFSETGSTA